jgi:uncharacterized protein with HEPN domain
MGRKRALLHLVNIKDSIEAIREYTRDHTYEDFCQQRIVRDAVARNLEIISEASRHIPDDFKSRHDAVPWPRVAALGNMLRHRYWETDPLNLWRIVQDDLGELRTAVEAMIAGWTDAS